MEGSVDDSKETSPQAKPAGCSPEPKVNPSQTASGKLSERLESETALSAAAEEEVEKRLFQTRLSIRYHSKRQNHFETIETFSSFFLLVLGSGAMATTAIKFLPIFASIIGMLIALITAIKIAFRFAYSAARHARFVESFTELESKFLSSKNDEEVDQVIGELLKLEAKEPPVLINLSVICYNETAVSGGQEGSVRQLSRWQELIANWSDYRPYQGIKP